MIEYPNEEIKAFFEHNMKTQPVVFKIGKMIKELKKENIDKKTKYNVNFEFAKYVKKVEVKITSSSFLEILTAIKNGLLNKFHANTTMEKYIILVFLKYKFHNVIK